MLPVIIFTILYNVPKFFELYVKEEVMTKTLNCTEVLSEDLYYGNMGCLVSKRGIHGAIHKRRRDFFGRF